MTVFSRRRFNLLSVALFLFPAFAIAYDACVEGSSFHDVKIYTARIKPLIAELQAFTAQTKTDFFKARLGMDRHLPAVYEVLVGSAKEHYGTILGVNPKSITYKYDPPGFNDSRALPRDRLSLLQNAEGELMREFFEHVGDVSFEHTISHSWISKKIGPGMYEYFKRIRPLKKLRDQLVQAVVDAKATVIEVAEYHRALQPNAELKDYRHIQNLYFFQKDFLSIWQSGNGSLDLNSESFSSILRHLNRGLTPGFHRLGNPDDYRPDGDLRANAFYLVDRLRQSRYKNLYKLSVYEHRLEAPFIQWMLKSRKNALVSWHDRLHPKMDPYAYLALSHANWRNQLGDYSSNKSQMNFWADIANHVFLEVGKILPAQSKMAQTLASMTILESYLEFSKGEKIYTPETIIEDGQHINKWLNTYLKVVTTLLGPQKTRNEVRLMNAVLLVDSVGAIARERSRVALEKSKPKLTDPSDRHTLYKEISLSAALSDFHHIIQTGDSWRDLLSTPIQGITEVQKGYLLSALYRVNSGNLDKVKQTVPSLQNMLLELHQTIEPGRSEILTSSQNAQLRLSLLLSLQILKAYDYSLTTLAPIKAGGSTDVIQIPVQDIATASRAPIGFFPISAVTPWMEYLEEQLRIANEVILLPGM